MIKKIGVLSSGLMVGAVINIACLPVLTRIYGIEAYGVYGATMAIVSVAAVIANGRLDQAILASDANNRYVLASAGLYITVAVAFLAGFFSTLLLDKYTGLVIGLGVASSSLYQLSYSCFMAAGRLRVCSALSALRVAALCTFQIFLGLYGFSDSLLDGVVLQSVVIIFLGLLVTAKKVYAVDKKSFSDNLDFLKNNAGHALINAFSHNVPYLLLGSFVGPVMTGYYAVIDRLCKVPINIFSQAIRQLFIKKISNASASSVAAKSAVKASSLMLLLAVAAYILAAVTPEQLYLTVLGSQWSDAKHYVLVLALGYVFVFSNPPVSGYIVAARKSHVLLRFQISELAIKIILFFVFLQLGGVAVLASFSLSLIFYNLMIYFFVLKEGGHDCSR